MLDEGVVGGRPRHRPLPDPRRRLAVPPRRHHAVPRPDGTSERVTGRASCPGASPRCPTDRLTRHGLPERRSVVPMRYCRSQESTPLTSWAWVEPESLVQRGLQHRRLLGRRVGRAHLRGEGLELRLAVAVLDVGADQEARGVALTRWWPSCRGRRCATPAAQMVGPAVDRRGGPRVDAAGEEGPGRVGLTPADVLGQALDQPGRRAVRVIGSAATCETSCRRTTLKKDELGLKYFGLMITRVPALTDRRPGHPGSKSTLSRPGPSRPRRRPPSPWCRRTGW